jgi:chemotaxis signal transduction protein
VIDEILEQRERLARAFDREFSLPISREHRELCDFLVVRLGVDWYAVRVDELSGVEAKKVIQPLPDAPPHCLGLAGVRGRALAIYDLGAVLGSPSPDRLSWFFQTKADPQVALLAPKADRYLRVPLDSIVPQRDVAGAIVGVVSDGGIAINVLSVGRVVDGIHGMRHGELSSHE